MKITALWPRTYIKNTKIQYNVSKITNINIFVVNPPPSLISRSSVLIVTTTTTTTTTTYIMIMIASAH